MSKGFRVQGIGDLLEEAMEEIEIKASEAEPSGGEALSTGLHNLDA